MSETTEDTRPAKRPREEGEESEKSEKPAEQKVNIWPDAFSPIFSLFEHKKSYYANYTDKEGNSINLQNADEIKELIEKGVDCATEVETDRGKLYWGWKKHPHDEDKYIISRLAVDLNGTIGSYYQYAIVDDLEEFKSFLDNAEEDW